MERIKTGDARYKGGVSEAKLQTQATEFRRLRAFNLVGNFYANNLCARTDQTHLAASFMERVGIHSRVAAQHTRVLGRSDGTSNCLLPGWPKPIGKLARPH